MANDQHKFNNLIPCQSLSLITIVHGSVSNVSAFVLFMLPLLSKIKSYMSKNCHVIFFFVNQITKSLNVL